MQGGLINPNISICKYIPLVKNSGHTPFLDLNYVTTFHRNHIPFLSSFCLTLIIYLSSAFWFIFWYNFSSSANSLLVVYFYLGVSSSPCYCHSLVLILILISIKTRSDNIFGQKPPHPTPPTHPTHPPGTQLYLISLKLLTFEVVHQNKSCSSILE